MFASSQPIFVTTVLAILFLRNLAPGELERVNTAASFQNKGPKHYAATAVLHPAGLAAAQAVGPHLELHR